MTLVYLADENGRTKIFDGNVEGKQEILKMCLNGIGMSGKM